MNSGGRDEKTKHIQAVATLIEEFRSNNEQVRLNAFRNIRVIANALGPVRTRDELVPYLVEFFDDDDEILLVLADELGQLLSYVGGPSWGFSLLPPLEALAGVEESSVRAKAVDSISKIIATQTETDVVTHIVPVLRRLSRSQWFTCRISATALFHVIHPKLNSMQRQDFRSMFVQLCGDETPMVRRSACSNLRKFVLEVEPDLLEQELFLAFQQLCSDDQDSVRLLCVEACVTFAQRMDCKQKLEKLFPLALDLINDKSWRVRYVVADHFCDLLTAFTNAPLDNAKSKDSKDSKSSLSSDNNSASSGGAATPAESKEMEAKAAQLVDGYVGLLMDNEAEVRTAGAFKLGEVSVLAGGEVVVNKFLPAIKSLVKDSCQYTRAALGSVILGIATVITKQEVYEHLLPLFLQLLKDGHPEVRLNMIEKLDTINEVISVEQLSQSLLPAITELARDSKWRVRLAIIRHIPLLARQFGQQFFEAQLASLCMTWLGDSVFSIRDAATANLTALIEIFGILWARVNIFPNVIELSGFNSYLFRMTALFAIKGMARVCGEEVTTTVLLPVVFRLRGDPVPNVRFNVAKTLEALYPYVTEEARDTMIYEQLKILHKDPDPDVKYHASVALLELQKFQDRRQSQISSTGSSASSSDKPSETKMNVDK